MKKILLSLLEFFAVALVCAGVLYALNVLYASYPSFRMLFVGENPQAAGLPVPGTAGATAGGAGASVFSPDMAGRISLYIFGGISLMQVLAFYLAFRVLHGVIARKESLTDKLERLKSADIFLDLPLYIGLFGTVSSFLMMTFCPQSSRLIAYSSTLIGIIFSVALRVLLLYPAQQKLMNANAAETRS